MKEKTAPVKLNLGAGTTEIPGYLPLDIKNGKTIYPLDYPDNSVDEIRASHVLEHFNMADSIEVLTDWVRALKPGGWLKIAVPNFDWVVQHYYDAIPYPMEGYVLGGQTDEHDFHQSAWTPSKLTKYFEILGMADISAWESEIKDCASLPVSLNLKARKPYEDEAVQRPKPIDWIHTNVSVCISLPRLCFSDFALSVAAAFQGLNTHYWQGSGVFWGQKLEGVLLKALNTNPDFIFTCDYDTVFTANEVRTLIALMTANPGVDAIAPIQQGRARSQPLFTVRDVQGKLESQIPLSSLQKALMPVNSAHFGLTIFRPSAFADLPHPWFKEIPGNNGYWDETKTDPDIWFWRHWKNNKRTVFIAPKVVVGHCEMLVGWPNETMSGAVYQQPNDYILDGQPAGTWGKPNAVCASQDAGRLQRVPARKRAKTSRRRSKSINRTASGGGDSPNAASGEAIENGKV